MKNSQALFKVAAKFQRKYAQSQTLQEIVTNASSYGDSSGNGIMNFIPKLKQFKAALNMRVVISGGLLGKSVSVAAPVTDPGQVAGAFAPLSEQVRKYIDRNLSGFPQLTEGTYDLAWDFREPANEGGSGIAQNPNW